MEVVAKRQQQAQPENDALSEIAEHSPGKVQVEERVQQLVRHQKFEGPIPHPDIFRRYGEVIPDAPERILRVFEQDSAHAREIQKAALDAQKRDNKRVHWMAWSLIAGGYALSALFAHWNKDWLAGIILTTTLTGTIAGFLQNKKAEKTDEDK